MALSSCLRRYSARLIGAQFLRSRPFFTKPGALLDSAFNATVPRLQISDVTPIPDGFPFEITFHKDHIELTREDQEEKTEVHLYLLSHKVKDGNPSVAMQADYHRGYLKISVEASLRPNSNRFHNALIREYRNSHVENLEEFLETKGIDASFIKSLFDFFKKHEEKTECYNTFGSLHFRLVDKQSHDPMSTPNLQYWSSNDNRIYRLSEKHLERPSWTQNHW